MFARHWPSPSKFVYNQVSSRLTLVCEIKCPNYPSWVSWWPPWLIYHQEHLEHHSPHHGIQVSQRVTWECVHFPVTPPGVMKPVVNDHISNTHPTFLHRDGSLQAPDYLKISVYLSTQVVSLYAETGITFNIEDKLMCTTPTIGILCAIKNEANFWLLW